jgi:hypothetical protein
MTQRIITALHPRYEALWRKKYPQKNIVVDTSDEGVASILKHNGLSVPSNVEVQVGSMNDAVYIYLDYQEAEEDQIDEFVISVAKLSGD